MLHKRHNSIIPLFILLSFVGASKPAKALKLAQVNEVLAKFSTVEQLSEDEEIITTASDSTKSSLKQNFDTKYSDSKVNLKTPNSPEAHTINQGKTNTFSAYGNSDNGVFLANGESDGVDSSVQESFSDSGSPNSEIEDSGNPNSDVRNSGELNPQFKSRGSGSVNPQFNDSGTTNPEYHDSGEINSDVREKSLAFAEINSAIAQNSPSTTEAPAEESTSARSSKKWLWLIPLLGIPLLGVIFLWGGQKKSDQEPALGDIYPAGRSPGESNRLNGNDGGAISEPDNNLSGKSGNVAENSLSNGSKLGSVAAGAAAVAGGNAATIFNRNDQSADEIEFDLRELEEVDEIPSNPVNEFTSQATQLQSSEQPTVLQTNQSDIESSIDAEFSSQLTADPELRLDNVVEDDSNTLDESPVSGLDLELETTEQVSLTDSVKEVDSDNLGETNLEREFRGDFVLQEETRDPFIDSQDVATDADSSQSTSTDESIEEARSQEPELSNIELSEPEVNKQSIDAELSVAEEAVVDTPDLDASVSLDENDPGSSTTEEVATPELDLSSVELSEPEVNKQSIDAELSVAEEAVVDTPDLDASVSLDENDPGLSITEEVATPELDLSNVELSEPEVNKQSIDAELAVTDADPEIIASSVPAAGAAIAGGAAVSGLLQRDSETTLPDDNQLELSLDDNSPEIDLSFDEITLEEDNNISELTLDQITFDDEVAVDPNLDKISDDARTNSLKNLSLDVDTPVVEDITLDSLGFPEAETSLASEALSTSQAEVSSLEDLSLDIETPELADITLDGLGFPEAKASLASETLSTSQASSLEDLSLDIETPELADITLDGLDDVELDTSLASEELSTSQASSLEDLSLDIETPELADITVDGLDDVELDTSLASEELSTSQASSLEDLSLDIETPELADITLDGLDDVELDTSLASEELSTSQASSLKDLSLDIETPELADLTIDGLDDVELEDTLPSEILINSQAEITSLADDDINDLNNISEWLESIDTTQQKTDITDNIAEWLSSLNTETTNMEESTPVELETDWSQNISAEADTITYEFLEDLLDRDSK